MNAEQIQEQKKLIARIKKLLALSKSPNAAESERALLKARELLEKYNLSMQDIKTEQEIEEHIHKHGRNFKKWRHVLAARVAEHYYCRHLLYTDSSNYYKSVFIGKSHNIIICESIFDYLCKAIEREAKNAPKQAKYKYREDFKYGMAVNICERLKVLRKTNMPAGKNLIVSEDALINQYYKDNGLNPTPRKFAAPKQNGYEAGKRAGEKVSLNDQLKNDRYTITNRGA